MNGGPEKIFITGGTGFLGQCLIPMLAPQVEKIYLLVREISLEKAQARFGEYKNVEYILGDITKTNVLSSLRDLNILANNCDTILHLAAYYDLQGPYAKSYMQNVVGTQNLLFLGREFFNLKYFHYTSTIAVAGDYQELFYEGDLDLNQGFGNYYAKTKFHAEELVRKWNAVNASGPQSLVKKRIYRPGILVGDSQSGAMGKIDGPYYFLRALSHFCQKFPLLSQTLNKWPQFNLPLPLPLRGETKFPLIPVDIVASWMVEMVLNPQSTFPLRSYHLYDPTSPTMQEFVQDALSAFDLPLKVKPLPELPINKILFEKILDMPAELLSYSYSRCLFDQSCLEVDFPHLLQPKKGVNKNYQDYKMAFLNFAKGMFNS